MSAYLKLAHIGIPRLASDIVVSSEAAAHSALNAFYGSSTLYWETGSTVLTSTITLTVNSTYAIQPAEYIAIRGLNLTTVQDEGNVRVQLRGSTDNFGASDVLVFDLDNIGSDDLVGPYNEDLIIVGALSTAYRYWRVRITTDNLAFHRLRKIHFGQFFDFGGRSPFYPYQANFIPNSTGFTADSGATFKTSQGRKGRQYNFSWRGIPDSVRDDFDLTVRRFLNDHPVFLYQTDDSDHDPLNGHTIVCGWMDAEISSEMWKDNNLVDTVFIEDIIG